MADTVHPVFHASLLMKLKHMGLTILDPHLTLLVEKNSLKWSRFETTDVMVD